MMNTTQNPDDAVKAVLDNPVQPDGDDEPFAGFGVMGLPFESGHYLALRGFPRHRLHRRIFGVAPRSGRHWTFYRPRPPAELRSLLHAARQRRRSVRYRRRVDHAVVVSGDDSRTARVVGPHGIDLPSRMLTTVATRLPVPAWTNESMFGVIGRVAGMTLGAGDVRLAGAAPNGQHFMVAPRQIWAVSARARFSAAKTSARPAGSGAGTAGRLPPAADRIGVIGTGHFENLDGTAHIRAGDTAPSATRAFFVRHNLVSRQSAPTPCPRRSGPRCWRYCRGDRPRPGAPASTSLRSALIATRIADLPGSPAPNATTRTTRRYHLDRLLRDWTNTRSGSATTSPSGTILPSTGPGCLYGSC